MYKSQGAKGRGIKSRSFSFFFVYGYTQACFNSETNFISGDEMTEDRENAGAVRGRRRTGRRFKDGYEKKDSVCFEDD